MFKVHKMKNRYILFTLGASFLFIVVATAIYYLAFSKSDQICIQVVTPAKNIFTSRCRDFPDPCSLPPWYKLDESCSSRGLPPKESPTEKKDYVDSPVPSNEEALYQCARDADCILVQEGCCGCRAGGRNTTINRKYGDYWVGRSLGKCGETFCQTVMSSHCSCMGEPKLKCLDGRCVDERCQ